MFLTFAHYDGHEVKASLIKDLGGLKNVSTKIIPKQLYARIFSMNWLRFPNQFPHRIAENAEIFAISLSKAEIKELGILDEDQQIGPDPKNYNF